MTRQAVLQHIAFMEQWDPQYSARELTWYHRTLPWLRLLPNDTTHNHG